MIQKESRLNYSLPPLIYATFDFSRIQDTSLDHISHYALKVIKSET